MKRTWKVYTAIDQARSAIYVGQTCQPMHDRVSGHKYDSGRYDTAMSRHIRTHGVHAFSWFVVAEYNDRCTAVLHEAELSSWLKSSHYFTVLNDGCGDSRGPSMKRKSGERTQSSETRMKISVAHKGHSRSTGSLNPRYDHTIYTFHHHMFGAVSCTQFELRTLADLNQGQLSAVVRGKQKSHKGWSICHG